MFDDLDHISFAEWLINLNACAIKAGYRGGPFVTITGQLSWHSFYEAGISPKTALRIEEDNAMKFGRDYCE